jgi:hypothetical protein
MNASWSTTMRFSGSSIATMSLPALSATGRMPCSRANSDGMRAMTVSEILPLERSTKGRPARLASNRASVVSSR